MNEPADDKKSSVCIYYNTLVQPLSELLSFPVHSSMMKQETDSPKVGQKKQRRLLGQTAKTPAQPEPETISDAPPSPKVVNPALTGRISQIPTFRNGK